MHGTHQGSSTRPWYRGENFHPSIADDSKAIDSDKEENNDENPPKIPYDGKNMNSSSDYEGNNDEDAPATPYDGENMNLF